MSRDTCPRAVRSTPPRLAPGFALEARGVLPAGPTLAAGLTLAAALTPSLTGVAWSEPSPLVTHWAPILYHDTDADRRDDHLTRFDFDGDWDPWNNQENMESGAFPLIGAVYYSAVETETHHFLSYTFFHPYDSSVFAATPEGGLCILHENDVEGVILTIRKDGSPFGELRVMATEAHGEVYYFKSDPSDVLIGSAYHDPATGGGGPDSTLYLAGPSGTTVAVFIEANGHGVGSQYRAMVPDGGGIVDLGGQTFGFIGGDGIVYFHDGAPGEEPTGNDPVEMVRYELRPLEELWDQRHNSDPGQPYCDSRTT